MEQAHRNIIQKYHVKLSKTVDLNLLYPVLLQKEVIFHNDLERLKVWNTFIFSKINSVRPVLLCLD